MILKSLLLSFTFLSVILFNAADTGLPGKWTGTLRSAANDEWPLEYNLQVNGGKLSGTGLSPQGVSEITNTKITGNDFTFDLWVDGQSANHSGKYIAAGDSISLTIDFNGDRFHSTLRRAK